MNPAAVFHDIVSGRTGGATGAVARALLRTAEVPYAQAVRWRNHRFDAGHRSVIQVNVPVISVGNLSLGGTGKTPMVKWIAKWCLKEGKRVAIVSRGYGTTDGTKNDEARELAQTLANVPHVQNPDRVAAARQAIAEHGAEVIVADDAFQHRRLARDLDVVLIDALEPFGFGHLFPRGTLREPVDGLRRAGLVCLTRSDLVPADRRREIRQVISQLNPHAPCCEAAHAPSHIVDATGRETEIGQLSGKRIAAFCGIGNPPGFRNMLAQLDCQLVAWREFPDHHAYTMKDAVELESWARHNRVEILVCTHKDLVKLPTSLSENIPLMAVAVEMRFVEGEDLVRQAIRKATK